MAARVAHGAVAAAVAGITARRDIFPVAVMVPVAAMVPAVAAVAAIDIIRRLPVAAAVATVPATIIHRPRSIAHQAMLRPSIRLQPTHQAPFSTAHLLTVAISSMVAGSR
jgi:hypothetical protein